MVVDIKMIGIETVYLKKIGIEMVDIKIVGRAMIYMEMIGREMVDIKIVVREIVDINMRGIEMVDIKIVVDCGCPGMMLLMRRRPEAGAPRTKLPAWCWMRLAMSL